MPSLRLGALEVVLTCGRNKDQTSKLEHKHSEHGSVEAVNSLEVSLVGQGFLFLSVLVELFPTQIAICMPSNYCIKDFCILQYFTMCVIAKESMN